MDKTKIEWCDSTWNPVTGCLHGCEYCYARRIAERFGTLFKGDILPEDEGLEFLPCEPERFYELDEPAIGKNKKREPYPANFYPTLHRYRLDEPSRWKKLRNIFVCSMADLFGEWVPDSWIEEVFAACEKAPWHRYLFLTKNQKRYEDICNRHMPPNMWFGWSQTEPMGDKIAFTTHYSVNTFVSVEPLLKPFPKFHIRGIGWIIVGAETGNRKCKIVPEKSWIDEICKAADSVNVPVFMKDSLLPIMGEENMRREFPWGGISNVK